MHQKTMAHLQLWMSAAMLMLTDRIAAASRGDTDDHDRGDVPGG